MLALAGVASLALPAIADELLEFLAAAAAGAFRALALADATSLALPVSTGTFLSLPAPSH
jgi:hypothetical protein